MNTTWFLLNRTAVGEHVPTSTPLLDVIRRNRRLTGCKDGCREGDCGACMILIGTFERGTLAYSPATACLVPSGAIAGRHVVTIEGLSTEKPNPIQQALVDQGGIQCGFCTPGIVVALTAFFLTSASSDIDAAFDAVAGNLCRCTGYAGIKRAIRQLCSRFNLSLSPPAQRLNDCLEWQILPPYFAGVATLLADLPASASPAQIESAVLIAGGTDWMVQQTASLADPSLHFLPAADNEAGIRLTDRQCRIAAATTIEQLRTSQVLQDLLPTLNDDLKLLCSSAVRQHATVGGNLANASPIADLAVIFLALNAELILERVTQQRRLWLRDFFVGYKQTACRNGERISEIVFDASAPAGGFSFEKVSKRIHLDIASVNSAMSLALSDETIAGAHIAVGGVAAKPLYLTATCEYLCGKPLKPETVLAAAAIAQTEISPISDLRGSVAYKRLLFRQLFYAHFLKLFPEQIHWEILHALG